MAAVVRNALDLVAAFVERELAREARRRAARPGPRRAAILHADGDAVDAPFDAPDPAAPVDDVDLDHDAIAARAIAFARRHERELRRVAARQHLVEVELRGRLAHQPARIAGKLFANQVR